MRLFTSAIILFSFTFTLNAYATAPVVTAISGASNYTLTTSSTGSSATIMAGLAGSGTACPNTSSNTCDNCSAAINNCGAMSPLCACNENRAFSTQVVTISVSNDTANSKLIIGKSDGTSVLSILKTSNSGEQVQFTWGDLCTQAMGGACDAANLDPNPTSIRIYVDKDTDGQIDSGEEFVEVAVKVLNPGAANWNVYAEHKTEGIGNFKPYPGDAKIYVEDVESTGGFPTLVYDDINAKVTKVRVYMSPNGMQSATPDQSLVPAELTVESEGAELSDSVVDGLENNTRYAFRIGLLDEANNVVQFFPSAAQGTANGCDTSPPAANCPWAATPDQVLGLLSEDFNCFIASAAYGTSIEPKLNVFRMFRFKILLQRPWGRKFVEKYYQYGPYAARYIHDKPVLRGITRGFLWPLYGFSLLSLSYGLPIAVATSLTLMISLLALTFIGMRRFSRRA